MTAGLSLLVLLGENPVTGKKASVKTWVLYAHGSVAFIGVFLALFCWWFARKSRRNQATDKDLVLRELEGIDPDCAEHGDRSQPSGLLTRIMDAIPRPNQDPSV